MRKPKKQKSFIEGYGAWVRRRKERIGKVSFGDFCEKCFGGWALKDVIKECFFEIHELKQKIKELEQN